MASRPYLSPDNIAYIYSPLGISINLPQERARVFCETHSDRLNAILEVFRVVTTPENSWPKEFTVTEGDIVRAVRARCELDKYGSATLQSDLTFLAPLLGHYGWSFTHDPSKSVYSFHPRSLPADDFVPF